MVRNHMNFIWGFAFPWRDFLSRSRILCHDAGFSVTTDDFSSPFFHHSFTILSLILSLILSFILRLILSFILSLILSLSHCATACALYVTL